MRSLSPRWRRQSPATMLFWWFAEEPVRPPPRRPTWLARCWRSPTVRRARRAEGSRLVDGCCFAPVRNAAGGPPGPAGRARIVLLDLQIRDFALIEELHLTFEKGLHVLSGETGAGKSIVIDAVAFVLGGRASVDMIRSGAQSARVEAVFDIAGRARLQSLLDEKGLKGDGGLLILRREFSSEGRSRCRVNDVLVTVGVLAEIGEQLVDIHGQHEHQSILKEERQRALLDAYGGEEGIRLVE